MEKIFSKVWKGCLTVLAVLTLFGMAGLFLLISLRGFHGLPPASQPWMMPAGQAMGWVSVLRIAVPVLLISLLILLGVWIGKSSRPTIIQHITTTSAPAETPEPDCPVCGRVMNEEWVACPYCGNHR